MKLLIAALVIATMLPCFARLGETRAQCNQRYGEGTVVQASPEGKAFVEAYNAGDISLIVTFLDNKAVNIIYGKKIGMITDSECAAILDKEGGDWGKPQTKGDDVMWDRSDGCSAAYSKGDNDMYILVVRGGGSAEAERILEKARAQEVTSKL